MKYNEFDEKPAVVRRLTPDQLPDLNDDEIIISLREEGLGTGKNVYTNAHLVLYHGECEIWKEPMGFEYYTRYLELGKILKEKYKEQLVDFDVKYTANLGGDHFRAFDKVRQFRKSLSGKNEMDDNEFDLITKSGHFDKSTATYWKALEFAKERHAGQTRDEGTPYFEHITGVIDILRQYGKVTDYTLTIAALHDILEDTDTTKDEIYDLLRTYPTDMFLRTTGRLYKSHGLAGEEVYDKLNNGNVRDIIAEVELLTHDDGVPFKEYIDRIFQADSIKREVYRYNAAAIVKLADRLHNLITLPLCGKPEKIQKKIRETEDYIMPWRDQFKSGERLFAAIEAKLIELKSK